VMNSLGHTRALITALLILASHPASGETSPQPRSPSPGGLTQINSCDGVVAALISREGAILEPVTRGGDLVFKHPSVSSMAITCSHLPPDLSLTWAAASPPISFFTEVGRAGEIVLGIPAKTISEGATACHRKALGAQGQITSLKLKDAVYVCIADSKFGATGNTELSIGLEPARWTETANPALVQTIPQPNFPMPTDGKEIVFECVESPTYFSCSSKGCTKETQLKSSRRFRFNPATKSAAMQGCDDIGACYKFEQLNKVESNVEGGFVAATTIRVGHGFWTMPIEVTPTRFTYAQVVGPYVLAKYGSCLKR
jgi:hypothetical protein